MQPSTKKANFSVFAPYFDSCGQQSLAELYFSKAEKALSGKEIRILADIGCGTGVAAQHFAEKGITVFAVDASAAMLHEAQTRRAKNTITYIHETLPNITLAQEADAVLCLGDTLNYVPPVELGSAIKNLCDNVNHEGFLLLDYTRTESYEQLDAFQTGEEREMQVEGKRVVMKCGYSRQNKIATITVSIYPDNVHEVHQQFAHADVTLSKLLRDNGFKIVAREYYNPFDSQDPRGFKTFIVAKKST